MTGWAAPFVSVTRLLAPVTKPLTTTGISGWTADTSATNPSVLILSTTSPVGPATGTVQVAMLPNDRMNPLFAATVQATEEAIVNSMVAAETMTGANGVTVRALPQDELVRILKKYNRLVEKN